MGDQTKTASMLYAIMREKKLFFQKQSLRKLHRPQTREREAFSEANIRFELNDIGDQTKTASLIYAIMREKSYFSKNILYANFNDLKQ